MTGKVSQKKPTLQDASKVVGLSIGTGLSVEALSLVCAPGYPLNLFVKKLAAAEFAEFEVEDAVKMIYRVWLSRQDQRRSESELNPKIKKKRKPKSAPLDPNWAKAKKLCLLNADDVRKAKELGFKPNALIKNTPAPTQSWKQPVKHWIRDLYQNRFG